MRTLLALYLALSSTLAEPEKCQAADMPKLALGDGHTIPAVGLGLYYTPPGSATYDIVSEALRLGYRHLDTAGFYENEADVGRAVRDSGIPRAEIHITSKVWPEESGLWQKDGYNTVLEAVRRSVDSLGTHADLFLIHAPFNPPQRINYWLALEEAQRQGLVRSSELPPPTPLSARTRPSDPTPTAHLQRSPRARQAHPLLDPTPPPPDHLSRSRRFQLRCRAPQGADRLAADERRACGE